MQIEEIFKKIDEMPSVDLEKKLLKIKQTIVSIKKGNRHPSTKVKTLNITTSNIYEKAEFQKYDHEIHLLESKLKQIRHRERDDNHSVRGGDEDSPKKQKRRESQFKKDFIINPVV